MFENEQLTSLTPEWRYCWAILAVHLFLVLSLAAKKITFSRCICYCYNIPWRLKKCQNIRKMCKNSWQLQNFYQIKKNVWWKNYPYIWCCTRKIIPVSLYLNPMIKITFITLYCVAYARIAGFHWPVFFCIR